MGNVVGRIKRTLSELPADFELTRDRAHYWVQYNPDAMSNVLRIEFEKFKAHHQAKGNRFKDWDAAWRTWVLNGVKFSGAATATPYIPTFREQEERRKAR